MFFGDEGGKLDREALHALPPLPLDLLPLHCRRCAAAAAVVASAASPPCCTATALRRLHLQRSLPNRLNHSQDLGMWALQGSEKQAN